MNEIKGLAIRDQSAGQGVKCPVNLLSIGGRQGNRNQILGDIFRLFRDTQHGTQYLFNRIPFWNWEGNEGSWGPGA
jgi:hypothetical protein